MRTSFDFSPFYRSSIGFDRVFNLLENAHRLQAGDSWPPYDIARRDENAYRITIAVAGFKPDANYFGIFIHKDVPANVRETVDMVWKNVIAKSDTVKKYAASNGAQFAPVYGDDAVKAAMPAIQSTGETPPAPARGAVTPPATSDRGLTL